MTDERLTPSQRLRILFNTLTCYKVTFWGKSSSDPDMRDREVADVKDADVVSSLRKDGRHTLVLDIDHQSWLVKSTTEGHYHLYVDVPGGIEHNLYMALLGTLADAGIIEQGYARASRTRGHSDVRLPWVQKPVDADADAAADDKVLIHWTPPSSAVAYDVGGPSDPWAQSPIPPNPNYHITYNQPQRHAGDLISEAVKAELLKHLHPRRGGIF